MCGIVGLITKGGIYPEDILRNMTRRIAHRGPDGEGVRVEGPVGLGHRRLSIIDPTGGHQPMSNEDGSVWITFNGEIYNYKELMAQLQSRGHQFKTRSDTEVVIHAWEEWGDCCVDRFRGMFAFGIADYRQGCVFLARDHFGIKPLVWCETEEAVSFGSEISPLLLTPGFNGSLDLTAIDQYLWLQYIPSPSSAYRQIRKLPPAHRLRVGFDGAVEKPRRYWSMRFDPEPGVSAADWEERIAAVVKESVDAHLMSDVPFGAFLSGGVDSSLVVAEMSELLSDRVRTFSIGFKESEFDETSYAAFAAKTCATIHTRGEMGSDALSLLPSLVRHYGEPFGDSSALPTWHVCKLARASVPMVLSGDGADELFAGYGTQASWMANPTSNVYDWIRCIHYTDGPVRSALWRPEFQSAFQPRQELFEQLWSESQSFSGLARVQYMDINTYLPFDILTKVDIASMMHGLEVRTPFVDLRVIEEAAKLPSSFSMIRAGDGSWNRKAMLKRVARRFFPDAFLNRPKMGFAMPVARWLAPGGEAYSNLMARLLSEDSSLRAYFRPGVMKTLLEGAATPTLWLLLFLEEWLRQHRDLPLPARPRPAELHSTAEPAEACAETPAQAADLVTKAAERGDLRAARRGLRQLVAQWPHSPAGIVGSQWLAQNPPEPRPRRPRLLVIADVPNWIFDRHAHVMQERLADEFDIDIAYGMDIKFRGQPVDEARYDLIHPLEWHMVHPENVGTPSKWVAGIRSHTSWEGWEPAALAQHLDRLYRGGVYVVSQRLLDIFHPLLPGTVALPHGVDAAFFTSKPNPQATAGRLRVGWAGNRAAATKGYDAFIAPLAHLPGVELDICGYSDRMLTLDEMRGFYESIDAYVCTSASEGHNNSLMEAAAMARAIVTTDVGTVPEFLEHEVSALIVPREAEAISQAILRLRDDPALRQRLGAQAQASVRARFDWQHRMEGYRRFFRAALSRQASGSNAAAPIASQAAQAFLFEPDWTDYGWVEVVHGYLRTFTPEDPVALILLLDPSKPGQIDPAEAGQSVLEVMASLDREAFPKVVLVDRPEEILEQIKPFPQLSWVRAGQWHPANLRGILGRRFSQSLESQA